jgi:ssDNA-binding Zn-finger/Zn-ribbon topoisomerase 1
LKQLNPSIDIPAYRVDFLMTYVRPNESAKTVVIEYDGYEYHFREGGAITEWNIDDHYIDEDVERQKALESYGYDFVRFNKFSLRGNAMAAIDQRLREVFEGRQQSYTPLPDIYDSYVNLQTGELRQCPECMEILEKKEFYDRDLPTKYGNKCMQCKGKRHAAIRTRKRTATPPVSLAELSSVTCPRCSSAMVLRKGPYGQFLGCSRFPLCRGTRKVK